MKFLCNDCQLVMQFVDNVPSEDNGSMEIRYICTNCARSISMITNSGETQMVRSLGVTIGHEAIQTKSGPMAMVRGALSEKGTISTNPEGPEPEWTNAALKRLSAAPAFVQGMVRRLYNDYARQKGYAEITPAIMTEAREALGLTEM